jgi:hypothetical protein
MFHPYYAGNYQIVYIQFHYHDPYWYASIKEYLDDKYFLSVQGNNFNDCKNKALDPKLINDYLVIKQNK